MSFRLATSGLDHVAASILLGGLVDDEDVLFAILLEAVLECLLSSQFYTILAPGDGEREGGGGLVWTADKARKTVRCTMCTYALSCV